MSAHEPAAVQFGSTRATLDAIGATLTGLWLDDVSILAGPGQVAPELGHHGAVLVPWPNRIADGRYEFEGSRHQLPINDAAFGHALHGLAFDQPWSVEQQGPASITFGRIVGGVDGFPFRVQVAITYTVTATGLICVATWRNVGLERAPFGIGFHPYFKPGPSPLAEWTLQFAASSHLESNPGTALPVRRRPMDEAEFDFREGRELGPQRFSVAYELPMASAGEHITLADPAGLTLSISTSAEYRWLQVFSGDLPNSTLSRTGVGIEPQTCPPNAFVTGTDLIVLEPGEAGVATWSVDAEPSPRS